MSYFYKTSSQMHSVLFILCSRFFFIFPLGLLILAYVYFFIIELQGKGVHLRMNINYYGKRLIYVDLIQILIGFIKKFS